MQRAPEFRFTARLDEEPKVELVLVYWSGARDLPCSSRSDNAPKVRFSATVGEEPEIEPTLT